eukprot:6415566-Amphidinium_carterae.1
MQTNDGWGSSQARDFSTTDDYSWRQCCQGRLASGIAVHFSASPKFTKCVSVPRLQYKALVLPGRAHCSCQGALYD